jgi:hypothetical protein
MPPRKPKQPTRPKAPKKTAARKGKAPSFNKETHVLGEDGKVYEKKIVSGHATAVGSNILGPKTEDHLLLERKFVEAIHKAHSEGISDPDEIKARILAVRTEHVGNR